MRRRDFIKVIGSVGVVWPLAARAQQPATPTIGFLRSTLPETELVVALRKGLNEVGYVDGQSVTIEYRWAENRNERLSALAADLVRRRCAVIIAVGNAAAFAAKAATTTIPIVFSTGEDPIKIGLVRSFNQPEGNVTGVYTYSANLQSKQLELLRELVPKAAVIGILVNPTSPDSDAREAREAAHAFAQELHVFKASSERDIDNAFAALAQFRVAALLIGANALFTGQRDQLVALAARHSLPVMHYSRAFVMAGGLISYGSNLSDAYRQTGIYAGRILKGAKPADLPVMLPTKFELVVNLKTAKALGLTVPPSLLARTDEVIE